MYLYVVVWHIIMQSNGKCIWSQCCTLLILPLWCVCSWCPKFWYFGHHLTPIWLHLTPANTCQLLNIDCRINNCLPCSYAHQGICVLVLVQGINAKWKFVTKGLSILTVWLDSWCGFSFMLGNKWLLIISLGIQTSDGSITHIHGIRPYFCCLWL